MVLLLGLTRRFAFILLMRMEKFSQLAPDLVPAFRLGLATRGNSRLQPDDIGRALDAGLNYFNWCGHSDGLSQALSTLSSRTRDQIIIAAQFSARSARQAGQELDRVLKELNSEQIDILTLYYVELEGEWNQITAPSGSLPYLKRAQQEGKVRLLGLTSHQRRLAAGWAQSGLLDLLMIRYNAAHRGAEKDVFPTTTRLNIPVVAFTCLRWTTLLETTPDNGEDYTPPPAIDWYRYVLSHPEIAVALMAPRDSSELSENLKLLDRWHALSQEAIEEMNYQGDSVRRWNKYFP